MLYDSFEENHLSPLMLRGIYHEAVNVNVLARKEILEAE